MALQNPIVSQWMTRIQDPFKIEETQVAMNEPCEKPCKNGQPQKHTEQRTCPINMSSPLVTRVARIDARPLVLDYHTDRHKQKQRGKEGEDRTGPDQFSLSTVQITALLFK
jgi:hypothetical protein